jgi:hypothetical protein
MVLPHQHAFWFNGWVQDVENAGFFVEGNLRMGVSV